ncbi:MAG: ABC transporter permease [Acidobacteriota bacterium]|nr:ABC transporter permease [Acidobacteriota bacterium]
MMRLLRVWFSRLKGSFDKKRRDLEFGAELQSCIEMHVQDNLLAGMAPEEARRQALLKLGGVLQTREACRDRRGIPLLEALIQDLRYALRQLSRSPGLTAVVVLSLALGIGANTAIFSLMDAVMLKTLPVKDPESLVLLSWTSPKWPVPGNIVKSLSGNMWTPKTGGIASTSFSYTALAQFQTNNTDFSSVFGFADPDKLNVLISDQASFASVELVTGNYFSGLGVTPVLGRAITAADDKAGAPPAAVISFGYWVRKFGRNASAIGKTAFINRVPFTIVGVAPPEFFGVEPGTRIDIWVPIATTHLILPTWGDPGKALFADSSYWWVLVMGRLKAGVTAAQARASMNARLAQTMTGGTSPAQNLQMLPQLQTGSASKGLNDLREQFSKPLWILMTLVALVLLIACANVANLLLSKSEARQKEMAVRMAIGAGRPRLIRQLLTESVMLALIGGACGLLLAVWGKSVLLALMASGRMPVLVDARVNLTALFFTAAVSLLTGILFGLAPALRATSLDLIPALKENSGGTRTRREGKSKLGRGLVVAQVFAALVLLIGAGLFVRTLENLENQNIGFNRRNLLLFGIAPGQGGYSGERLTAFYKEMLLRIQALPGVESASLSQHGLIGTGETILDIMFEGHTPKPLAGNKAQAWVNVVGPRFFKTTGTSLLLGRGIGVEDTASSTKVVVINEALARQVFGKANPIGNRISLSDHPSKTEAEAYTIAGVVQNAKFGELRKPSPPTIYISYLQTPWHSGHTYFEVRTAADPAAMIPAVRKVAGNMDRNLPLFDVNTESEKIAESLMQERLFARLSSFFGVLALLLACIGLYGVMSYSVARRTNEIGIRLALGAQRKNILWMVMKESLLLTAGGLAIGLLCALAASKLVSSILFGLNPTDPLTFAGAAALLLAVAAFAGYLPARRASRVDPLAAIKYE